MNKPLTWLFPDAVAREYEADLRRFARAITQTVAEVLRLHQDDWRSDMMRILMDLPQQLQKQTEHTTLQVAAHAQAVNRFNDKQFHHVVSSAYGQDFYKPEPFLQDALQAWTLENARLIQSIPEQYIGQVQQMVANAAVNGWDEATLKAKIADSFRLPEARAALIANDQIGKLNGQLTRLRQQNIGIKQYRWRGKLDSRERNSHLKREGKIFDWDNPPSGGHPGSEINCRCHAQMILPEMAEIDALFFGDGGNRHYNAEMTRRGLTPETGGAAVYANPFAQYGYLPRGGVMSARSSGSLQQTLETVARQAVQAVAVETVAVQSVAATSAAAQTIEKARAIEPFITDDMKAVAQDVGAQMAGLAFALKSEQSLVRKIETEMLKSGIGAEIIAKEMHDVIRYTILLQFDEFVSDYEKTVHTLKQKGYNLLAVKNTWRNGASYKGINTNWIKAGQVFELQFHTQESFHLKNSQLHQLYEEWRLPETNLFRKRELEEMMIGMSALLPTPFDIEKIE